MRDFGGGFGNRECERFAPGLGESYVIFDRQDVILSLTITVTGKLAHFAKLRCDAQLRGLCPFLDQFEIVPEKISSVSHSVDFREARITNCCLMRRKGSSLNFLPGLKTSKCRAIHPQRVSLKKWHYACQVVAAKQID